MASHINQDRLKTASRGDLMDPHQSAGFVSDPFLTPVNQNTHPLSPDPSPSTSPALFDPSTSHSNNHYHPEKKLGKKKKAKKLGTGAVAQQHQQHQQHMIPGNTHATESFTEHEQAAEDRQRKMGNKLQHQHEEEQRRHPEESEESEEEVDESEREDQTMDNTQATTKPPTSGKEIVTKSKTSSDNSSSSTSSSILSRASGVASSVVSSATGAVNSALTKVGLHKENAKDTDTTADKEQMDQQHQASDSTKKSTDKSLGNSDKDQLSTSNEEKPRKSSIGGMVASATASATGMFNSVLSKVGLGGNKDQANSNETGKEEVAKSQHTASKELE